MIIEHKGELHPQIVIEDDDGKLLDVHYLPEGPTSRSRKASTVTAGSVLAKTPREASGITGHHRRSAARHRNLRGPQAEGPGRHRRNRRHGRDSRREAPRQEDHHRPQRKRASNANTTCRTASGSSFTPATIVKAGQPLIDGPLVPHDILRITGEEAVQQYLLHEIQSVYRSQRVEINDKHIEIIIARMLRKVQIENPGDTSLLPGW